MNSLSDEYDDLAQVAPIYKPFIRNYEAEAFGN